MPKVSVIMGTYNGESTLDAAIQSICDQTFTDWEFIICDDCPTNKLVFLKKSYCKIADFLF